MMRQKLRAQGIGKYDAETVTAQFLGHLQHLDGILAAQPWLTGAQCTIADIAVASQLAEVQRTSHLAARFGDYLALSAWLQKVS
jgi:glutathione S-transferase